MNKKLISFIKIAWIILGVCAVLFFAVAVTVYATAKPKNVTELLEQDGSWLDIDTLAETSGDLEVYPYVTKVYSCGIDTDNVKIVNFMNRYDDKIPYGVATDESAEHNYTVEFFVYSNAADKSVVKRFWNMSVEYDGDLTVTQNRIDNGLYDTDYFGDIKREYELNYYIVYKTFIRITAKSGSGDIDFKNVIIFNGEVLEYN